MLIRICTLSVVLCAILVVSIPGYSDVTIVKSGKPIATIVTPLKPSAEEKLSAEKLQYYIHKITGATLPITAQRSKVKGNLILVGKQPGTIGLGQWMQANNKPDESSYVNADNKTVRIVGIDEVGTLHATYFVLESFGCRWYFPGDWGTVIPKLKTLVIKSQQTVRSPSFKIRAGLPTTGTAEDTDPTWALNEWGRGNHLGGYQWWGAGHSYDYMISAGSYFTTHPEWFALRNGKRDPAQLCTTNPEMRKEAVKNLLAQLKAYGNNVPRLICISPNDNNSFCECDECKKLIPTLSNGEKQMGNSIDRIADFANYMCDEIQKVYPDHYVTYYCHYHSVGTPKIIKPVKDTVFWLTHWGDDHFHGVNDNSKLGAAINDWSKLGNPLFLYTYWGAYGSYSFWPAVHAISSDIPYFYKKGAIGVYSETHQNWGGQHLNFIVFPRQLWDVNTNVDAYIDDFCDKFYGPAAKPMREYYRKMEVAAKNGPAQYQVMELLIPVFNPDLLKELHSLIDDANAKIAGSDQVYKTRMDFVSNGFKLGELYFGAQHLIREYGRTKDPSIRLKVAGMFEESLKILEDPKYKFRLTNPEFAAEPIVKAMLSSLKQGTSFDPGDFSYSDGFYLGGRTFIDAVKRVGFIDGTWGLDMDSNGEADLIYDMQANGGNFSSFRINRMESYPNIAIKVMVGESADGPWTELADNAGVEGRPILPFDAPVDITSAISGKSRFFLRINLRNKIGSYTCAISNISLQGNVIKQ